MMFTVRSSRFSVCAVFMTVLMACAPPAMAHFQMLYVEESALKRGVAISMEMVFTHPFAGGPTMAMGQPRVFQVVSQRGDEGKAVKTDLKSYMQPIQWQGISGQADAYQAIIPREVMRSLGDYVFTLEPEPYLEKEEDKYIQQFTKLVMNVGGVPGNWHQPQVLPAEIQPLNKPYANWVGGVFRGVVLAQGQPVPFAEIEIEYVNHTPDVKNKAFAIAPSVVAPHPAYGNMSIRADASGVFEIGLPRAGWWGVCALHVGPVTQHLGKPLSQDAVLWIQAKDMR